MPNEMNIIGNLNVSSSIKKAGEDIIGASVVAADYDNTATYAVGAVCMNSGILYQCNTAISVAEDFDPTHWDAITVADLIAAQLTNVIGGNY